MSIIFVQTTLLAVGIVLVCILLDKILISLEELKLIEEFKSSKTVRRLKIDASKDKSSVPEAVNIGDVIIQLPKEGAE